MGIQVTVWKILRKIVFNLKWGILCQFGLGVFLIFDSPKKPASDFP